MLSSVGYPSSTANRILKRLVLEKGRPSHGYVIDVDEAKELKIRAKEMDDQTEMDMLRLLGSYRAYERKAAGEGSPLSLPEIRMAFPKVDKKKKKESRPNATDEGKEGSS